MAFVRAILSAFVVTIVLDLVLGRNQKKSYSSDKYHFTTRCSRSVIPVGCVGVGLFAAIELGAYFSHQDMPLIVTVLMALLIALPGLALCMFAIPGFWEMRVDDDDVTITKLFFIKRHWKISQIERCVAVVGEMRVYVKGRRRMAFLVDGMFDKYNTFVDRMNLEQIPIVAKGRGQQEADVSDVAHVVTIDLKTPEEIHAHNDGQDAGDDLVGVVPVLDERKNDADKHKHAEDAHQ